MCTVIVTEKQVKTATHRPAHFLPLQSRAKLNVQRMRITEVPRNLQANGSYLETVSPEFGLTGSLDVTHWSVLLPYLSLSFQKTTFSYTTIFNL